MGNCYPFDSAVATVEVWNFTSICNPNQIKTAANAETSVLMENPMLVQGISSVEIDSWAV